MLTERDNVSVRSHANGDTGIELLAEILQGGKSTLRFFGVRIVALMDLPEIQNVDEQVRSHPGKEPVDASIPVCVFVVGVRKPEGVWRWLVEPVVQDGRALLRRDTEATWQTLNEAGAALLIDQVNAWYDALKGETTPQPRERHPKTKS
jgi:hypothetical protein